LRAEVACAIFGSVVRDEYRSCGVGRAVVLVSGLIAGAACAPSQPAAVAWQDDWSVQRGFAIEIDTAGYTRPSALAFVPEPGPDPGDPLYFVTELGGVVKVVTNDRRVHTFARDFFTRHPIPDADGAASLELGLAGICLDQPRGYVFVTFVYHDADNVLRNNIVRFATTPGRFRTTPTARVDFSNVFVADRSSASHQIGPCQVGRDGLYVGVGDGEQPAQSQSLGSTLGKILRMTVDGDPVPTNPFFDARRPGSTANYVWAYGLRNPFGLKLAEGLVVVADNGIAIDRILTIDRGENYLWDGTDRSIGAAADAVLAPGRGVTQTSYHPRDSNALSSEYRGSFFQVVSGDTSALAGDVPPTILAFDYDVELGQLASVPQPFLTYRGQALQTMSAADIGTDGLYFTGIFPNSVGTTPVYRVTRDGARPHPHVIGESLDPRVLMADKGCFGCHALDEHRVGTQGPVLDREVLVSRLEARLASPAYTASLATVDAIAMEPFLSFRDARQEVSKARGVEKLRLWITYHLLEPRFDHPDARMPALGLSAEQARAIASYLIGAMPDAEASFMVRLRRRLERAPWPVVLVVGIVLGVFAGAAGYHAMWRRG
jgi:cytochrome c551/c552